MLGSIIGAVGNLVGGLVGSSSQDEQIDKQIAAQKAFAKTGIRWRTRDALAAGIHPLYAMGANTPSFNPIGVGGNPLGEGIAAAGNEIARGIQAKGTSVERAYNAKIMQLQLQRGELENQLLASRLARENSPTQRQPAMPLVGPSINERFGITAADGDTTPIPERFGGTVPSAPNLVVNTPLERIMDPDAPYREPGAVAEGAWVRTPGGMAPSPSYDFNERAEDVFGPDIGWSWRNMVLPNVYRDPQRLPPLGDDLRRQGYRWEWSTFYQEYQLVK